MPNPLPDTELNFNVGLPLSMASDVLKTACNCDEVLMQLYSGETDQVSVPSNILVLSLSLHPLHNLFQSVIEDIKYTIAECGNFPVSVHFHDDETYLAAIDSLSDASAVEAHHVH